MTENLALARMSSLANKKNMLMELTQLNMVSLAGQIGFFDGYALLRRTLMKSQVVILMYHRVCTKNEPEYLEALDVKTFEWQMEYLCKNFQVLSLDELVRFINSGKPLPNKAVVLTFDDGYKDNYLYAYPILQEHHIPATIFLATGHIDTDKLFWWDKAGYAIYHSSLDQLEMPEIGRFSLESEKERVRAKNIIINILKKMSANQQQLAIEKLLSLCNVEVPKDLGRKLLLTWEEVREMSRAEKGRITFGAHSVNHDILTKMPLDRARKEIVQSKMDIAREVGKDSSAFCYPNGNFNPQIVEIIKNSGFTSAVSLMNGQLIGRNDDVYRLSRIRAREDFQKFKATICGLWGDFRTFKSEPHI